MTNPTQAVLRRDIPFDEVLRRWPRIIESIHHGLQLPDRSLDQLATRLDLIPASVLADPVEAARHIPELERWCTPAALRAYCWAFVGPAAARIFKPDGYYFGNYAEWRHRGALLLAGMDGCAIEHRTPYSPELLAWLEADGCGWRAA